jgi:two-component system, cell cycle sensor histidine kinase and response regulator CckA
VQSEPGKGSRFVIHLPRLPAGPAGEAVPAEAPPPTGRERILLVEDDPMLARSARSLLEALGYQVTSAGGAGEALAVLAREAGRIDLVLTDVIMPGLNGAQLRERVVAAHPGVRVVLMSGHTSDAVSQRGVLDGELDFLQKPFSMAALARTVRRALDRPAG